MKIRNMKKMTKVALALCATLGLGGCGDLYVPDLNNPSLESFQRNPTRSNAIGAATGLLIGHRAGKASQNGYVSMLGVLGRESYVLDTADPRYVGEMLAGPGLDPGSPAFGGNFWAGPYVNIRNAHTLLDALDKVPGMTDAEKESIRGFAKTIQALEFLTLVSTRDTEGAPIDVNRPLGDELAPIATKDQVLAHIATLLDEAKAHLANGGDAFPFPLSSGFAGFDEPDTFLQFNRAVKARVDVYRQDWDAALADLSESFLSEDGNLDLGVYHAFGSGSGDTVNGLNSPNVFAHPSIMTDAQMQTGSTTEVDARVLRKVKTLEKGRTWNGVTSDLGFTQYESNTAPLPIIRNEELILLQAEAHIGNENYPEAMRLLNLIRTRSGNLEAVPEVLEGELIVDELLEQRRFSLLFEGGHRWIDMRRYGKLGELPLDAEGHKVHERFPIPTGETDARK